MAADNLKSSEDSPIHVLHFIPGSPRNEVQMVFAKRQAVSLETEGVKISYVYFEDRKSIRGIYRGWRDLTRTIRATSPDIVHAHFGTITGMVAALAKRVPLVITFRGSDLNPEYVSTPISSFLKNLMSQLAALRADRIITVSEQLLERLWWKRSATTVIPSGVDIEAFRPIDRLKARKQLDWAPDENVVLINVTSGSTNKRLDLAEETVEGVKGDFPNTRLFVMSGGIPPAEIPVLLGACNCLLMLSDHEGSPNIVKEAMACNLPIVSFDVGDVKQQIEGVRGCTLVPRSVPAVVDAVKALFQKETHSEGREKIRDISMKQVALRIIAVYRGLLRGSH